MKKTLALISCFLLVIFLSGCELGNTPTKKVENFLDNYRNYTTDVDTQLDDIINTDTTMTTEQKDNYKKLLKRQYQDLTYEIKDEVVDGDKATVTAEIEVYDYYKSNKASTEYFNKNQKEFMDEKGNILDTKFIEYKLKELTDVKDRVKYTIDFTLTKTNNTWVLDDIDDTTRLKIHGLYEY